ncbi:MAG TPA: hypothetical protein VMW17_07025 [Candidatus Binatia bacterium]|nr:hypothetical protein [Candidatus Binatia bacterium]
MKHLRAEPFIVCPVCETRYTETEGQACRVACPFQRGCRRLSCPYCAHELPRPSRLTRWLTRRLRAA